MCERQTIAQCSTCSTCTRNQTNRGQRNKSKSSRETIHFCYFPGRTMRRMCVCRTFDVRFVSHCIVSVVSVSSACSRRKRRRIVSSFAGTFLHSVSRSSSSSISRNVDIPSFTYYLPHLCYGKFTHKRISTSSTFFFGFHRRRFVALHARQRTKPQQTPMHANVHTPTLALRPKKIKKKQSRFAYFVHWIQCENGKWKMASAQPFHHPHATCTYVQQRGSQKFVAYTALHLPHTQTNDTSQTPPRLCT